MNTEQDVVVPVLQVLAATEKGQLSTTDLRAEVKAVLPLKSGDLEPINNRPDYRIDQTIRNLKSHKNVPGNPFCEGLLEDVHRGFKITAKGRKAAQQ